MYLRGPVTHCVKCEYKYLTSISIKKDLWWNHSQNAQSNCSQIESPMMSPIKHKQAVRWTYHDDFAFCQTTLFAVIIIVVVAVRAVRETEAYVVR